MDTKVIKVVNAGKCMICGREIKVAIGRGSGKFPNVFFCEKCDAERIKYDQNKK